MRIAVWKTGHEIADTVADVLAEGFKAEVWPTDSIRSLAFGTLLCNYDAHIGYGILRGMGDVMKECDRQNKPFFHLDRGYFNPGHFDGYYRISHRGTQARWHDGIPRKPIDIKLEPWRKGGEYILICPPTEHVRDFFGLKDWYWRIAQDVGEPRPIIRHKGDPNPIEWDKIMAVITFNSSVGWQALQRGIPVLSDPNHSIIGSHYAHHGVTDLQSLTDFLSNSPDTRMELFESMAAHQFTLQEIREGKAWELIKHYLSSSDSIAGKPSPLKSAHIPSDAALKARFQSTT